MVLCIDSLPLVCLVLLISCYCILYFFFSKFSQNLICYWPVLPLYIG